MVKEIGIIVGRIICICMIQPCIYQIKNIINNKCYIGSTINYEKRKQKHLRLLRKNLHHCRHLQSSFNLYKENNFQFSIVEIISDPITLVYKEDWWIKKLNPEYNVIKSGILNHLGLKRSEETRRKISIALTGRHLDEITKKKLSVINTGKKQSYSTIQKKREKNFNPIVQLDLNNNLINEWKSATEASEKDGYNRNCIYRCLRKEVPHYRGFVWNYKSS